MILVVPPDHEWAGQEVSVEELKSDSFVARELGSGSRRVIEDALREAGLDHSALKTTLTLDTTEGILSAVEAGLGVAFVSRWAVRNQLTLGTLKIAHVQGLNLKRVFSVAHRQGALPQGSAGAFHRFVLSNAYEMAPRPTGNVPPSTPLRKGKRP